MKTLTLSQIVYRSQGGGRIEYRLVYSSAVMPQFGEAFHQKGPVRVFERRPSGQVVRGEGNITCYCIEGQVDKTKIIWLEIAPTREFRPVVKRPKPHRDACQT
jgi:hypothetical protein